AGTRGPRARSGHLRARAPERGAGGSRGERAGPAACSGRNGGVLRRGRGDGERREARGCVPHLGDGGARAVDTRRGRGRRRPRRRRRDRLGADRTASSGRGAGRAPHDREPGGRRDDAPRRASVRVLIAEDLALLRDGLARLLRDNGFDVVDAVADADALVHAVRRERPDVAIVDIRLPPSFRDEGLRAALELRRTAPETAILVVSQYVEHEYATELLAEAGGGGVGYLLKVRIMDVGDFVDAVRRV